VAGFGVDLLVGTEDRGVDGVGGWAAGGRAFEGERGGEEVGVDVGAELGREDVEEGSRSRRCCVGH
jgi:hypothetical protein